MSTTRKPIVIADYNSAWPQEFLRLKDMLWTHVGDVALEIVHFGSTAVPGLAAKPVIDLAVVMRDRAGFPAVKQRLETLGFVHEGDLGIPGREAFKGGPQNSFMPYHLYVCAHDTPAHLKHLAFRDYLRQRTKVAEAYAELKRTLAELCQDDGELYTSSKTAFVEHVMQYALTEKA